MFKKANFFCLALIICVSSCLSPEEKLTQQIADLKTQTEFNGIIYVEQEGNVLVQDNIVSTEQQIPSPNPNSKVYLASLTKLFTEIVTLKLIEENKLHLDSTIATYKPHFKPDFGKKITLRHLLKMNSGLPRELNSDSLMNNLKFNSEDMAGPHLDTIIPDFELKFEPGSDTSYSNLNYWILGSIIEQVSGLSMNDAYSHFIFTPLKMNNSGYSVTNGKPLEGYIKENNSWKEKRADYKGRYTSGGCFSSLNDLILLSKALLANNYLSADSSAFLFNSDNIIEVYGALPNYTNLFYLNRDENVSTIILNNIGVPDLTKMSDLKSKIDETLDISLNKTSKKRRVKLINPSNLNDSIPLEAGMKKWIAAVENGNKEEIYAVLNENSVEGTTQKDDPVWDELVKHSNELPNFKAHGYRWVENSDLNGLEVWFLCDGDERLAFLWIVDEADKTKSTGLFIMPDNITWMGQKFN